MTESFEDFLKKRQVVLDFSGEAQLVKSVMRMPGSGAGEKIAVVPVKDVREWVQKRSKAKSSCEEIKEMRLNETKRLIRKHKGNEKKAFDEWLFGGRK